MARVEPVIFDGHNDVLSNLYRSGGFGQAHSFLDGRDGAVDLIKAREGGFSGGFFAIYVPSSGDPDDKYDEMTARLDGTYEIPGKGQ